MQALHASTCRRRHSGTALTQRAIGNQSTAPQVHSTHTRTLTQHARKHACTHLHALPHTLPHVPDAFIALHLLNFHALICVRRPEDGAQGGAQRGEEGEAGREAVGRCGGAGAAGRDGAGRDGAGRG